MKGSLLGILGNLSGTGEELNWLYKIRYYKIAGLRGRAGGIVNSVVILHMNFCSFCGS